jgi:hypothetical protein
MPSIKNQPVTHTSANAVHCCRLALWWTIGVILFTLPFRFYDLIIYSYLPSSFYTFGPFLLVCLRLGTIIFSVYFALRYFTTHHFQSFYPLFIVLLTYLAILQTDAFDINIKSYCSFFRDEREYVIKSFCSGKLHLERLECDECRALPSNLKHLTLGKNSIKISCQYDTNEGIFTISGFLDNSEALLYRSDDSLPEAQVLRDLHSIERLEKNWFFTVE